MSIYMRYTRASGLPVAGLVNTAPHVGWIQLEDARPVVPQLGTASIGRGTRLKITDITVVKREDTTSNAFLLDAHGGIRAKIVIDFVTRDDKKGEVVYLTLKLEDAVVAAIGPSLVEGQEVLTITGKIAIHRWGPGPDSDRWWSLS
jgi:type VI protein secretion system component Hcp